MMNPWTGAIYALASYPTYNQVAAAQRSALPREPLRRPGAAPPLLNQATQGVVSDRLDVQADRRRGRALRGDHHAVDPAALHGLVHGRHHRSTTSRRASTRACRCRPRSRSRATRGSTGSATSSSSGEPGHPALGETARARAPDRLRRAGRDAGPDPDSRVAREDPPRAVVRGPVGQPLDRPGLTPRSQARASSGRSASGSGTSRTSSTPRSSASVAFGLGGCAT